MHKQARIAMIGWILVGVAMLVVAPAWAADSNTSPTVSLTQAVHFMDAKGQDLVVGPGEFRVEAAGKSGLKLTPADGKEPIVIEGQGGSVKAPVALSVPVNEDEHHLVLLLPKGQFVEVVGSPNGIRSRDLKRDLDQPFVRRLRYIINFPPVGLIGDLRGPMKILQETGTTNANAVIKARPSSLPPPQPGGSTLKTAPIMRRGVEPESPVSAPTGQGDNALTPK